MARSKKTKAAKPTAVMAVARDVQTVAPQPSVLYANTLKALTDARDSMLTLEWHQELNGASAEQQRNAAQTLLRVENAIMALSNARLSEIAQKMSDSAEDLKSTTGEIEKAEQTLANIAGFLNAAAALVGVVAKIVPLV